jgi:integrase
VGVSVRKKGNDWYLFVRHRGERAAQKMQDEQHARDTAKAVAQTIATGQYDISKVQRQPAKKEDQPRRDTLKQYYDGTLQPQWESALSGGTYANYSWAFDTHILPSLGDIETAKLDREHIKKFVVTLRDKVVQPRPWQSESTAKNGTRKLAKSTIKLILCALRVALNEAIDSKIIAANPATRLGRLYNESKKYRDEIEPFTSAEVTCLLETMRQHYDFQSYVILLALLHTGLRSAECAGLQWQDLDIHNRFLIIRRQFSRGKIKNQTKTSKRRSVDVSTVLLAELERLKAMRREKYLAKGKNEIPEFVFLNTDGKPMDMQNFRERVYNKCCDKAQIRRRRLHDTRHTFASLLLMNGESLKYVSDQLGHSSIVLTADTYSHFIPGFNRAAVDRLPNADSRIERAAAGG